MDDAVCQVDWRLHNLSTSLEHRSVTDHSVHKGLLHHRSCEMSSDKLQQTKIVVLNTVTLPPFLFYLEGVLLRLTTFTRVLFMTDSTHQQSYMTKTI